MPQYKITSPDGKQYVINAPEGASQEQALAYFQSQHQAAQPQPDQMPDATASPTFGDKIGAAASDLGRAAVMTGRSALHGVLGIPELLHDGLVRAPYNAVAQALGSDSRINPGGEQIDSLLNRVGVPDPQPQNGVERFASNVDRGLGGLIGGVGIGGALSGSANQTAQGVGRVLNSNLGSQAAATVAGTGTSDLVREAGGGNTAQIIGGLAGGFSPAGVAAGREGLLNAGTKLLSKPSPQVGLLAEQAMAQGIPLKASQVSPSKVGKLIDSVTGQVPFSGSQNFAASQQTAFNRAVGNTIGVDSPVINAPVFAQAKKAIGASYDDLASRIDPQITPAVQTKLDGVLSDAKQFGNGDSVNAVQSALDRVNAQSVNSVIPGSAYKSLDSQLGGVMKNGGEKGNYAGQVRQILRDAFTDSASPADQAQMALANKQYANLKTIEPLVAADSVGGDISAAKLLQRVNANGAGKASMATGTRGDLGDLANIGQLFIKQQVPDSGTAQRLATMKLMKTVAGSGIGAAGATGLLGPGSLLAGAGLLGMSRGTQSMLQNPALVNSLLGNKTSSQIQRLLEQYANPAAQSALQSRH